MKPGVWYGKRGIQIQDRTLGMNQRPNYLARLTLALWYRALCLITLALVIVSYRTSPNSGAVAHCSHPDIGQFRIVPRPQYEARSADRGSAHERASLTSARRARRRRTELKGYEGKFKRYGRTLLLDRGGGHLVSSIVTPPRGRPAANHITANLVAAEKWTNQPRSIDQPMARPTKYQTLTEYRHEVAASAVVFRSENENSVARSPLPFH
ncbi:hypothetical protein EVAR_92510_1 [Eumeta japonica]|uniref:Uncharacterized protein n=1 Tax=Eumeta variegata TaxID=151549 RepID=A0A4C1T667_EUMVA|nr:hypothetical protein EVAR_92510_1 [Eumeta japonica]